LKGDRTGVDVFLEAATDQPERVVPDADDVELLEDRAVDSPSVDERAVAAAEISQLVAAIRARSQLGVEARDEQVVDDDVVLQVTTDSHALADRLVDSAEDAADRAIGEPRDTAGQAA